MSTYDEVKHFSNKINEGLEFNSIKHSQFVRK